MAHGHAEARVFPSNHTHRHLQQHNTRLQNTMSAMSAPTAMMAIATPAQRLARHGDAHLAVIVARVHLRGSVPLSRAPCSLGLHPTRKGCMHVAAHPSACTCGSLDDSDGVCSTLMVAREGSGQSFLT